MYIEIKIQVVTVEIKFVHMEYFQIKVADQILSKNGLKLIAALHILDILSRYGVENFVDHLDFSFGPADRKTHLLRRCPR
jgi:hypothetical protein